MLLWRPFLFIQVYEIHMYKNIKTFFNFRWGYRRSRGRSSSTKCLLFRPEGASVVKVTNRYHRAWYRLPEGSGSPVPDRRRKPWRPFYWRSGLRKLQRWYQLVAIDANVIDKIEYYKVNKLFFCEKKIKLSSVLSEVTPNKNKKYT